MTLGEFKSYIEATPKHTAFKLGISEPFSWRGSYDEVAFRIEQELMSREVILKRIDKALTETFMGYKGGEFKFGEFTSINFEEGISSYTDGGYCNYKIEELSGGEKYQSRESILVNLAFG